MSLLKKVQALNQMDADIVMGYTRRVEHLHYSDSRITSSVSYVCLLYYSDSDYFDQCGDGAEINDKKDTVNIIEPGSGYQKLGTALGNTKIDVCDDAENINMNMTYSWTFKCLHRKFRNTFGIPTQIGISANRLVEYSADIWGLWADDVVTMQLIVKTATLKFYINGKESRRMEISNIPLLFLSSFSI